MTSRKVNRRRFVAGTAAASTAMVAAPFVRGAYAAGQVSVFFWDHWVPAGNVEIKKQVAAFSEKNKVEVKADFITSQGQQNLLTINAEAQARRGHDIVTIGNWNVRDHADKLENVDDVVGRLVAKNGEANAGRQLPGQGKGQVGRGAVELGHAEQGPGRAHQHDEGICRHRRGEDVSGGGRARDRRGQGMDQRRHAEGRRSLLQGGQAVRHRPRHHGGQRRHRGLALRVVRRRAGRRQGQDPDQVGGCPRRRWNTARSW